MSTKYSLVMGKRDIAENKGFLTKLGHKIRILRDDKDLSQEVFAEICDIERSYLSNVEKGKANPSILYLKKIAKNLDIEIIDLLTFTI